MSNEWGWGFTRENVEKFVYFLPSKHPLWDVSLAYLGTHKLVIHGTLENNQKLDQHISGTQK